MTDAEIHDRTCQEAAVVDLELQEQPSRVRVDARGPGLRPLATPARETTRQRHVVHHGQIRHEVEHLEDEADVIRAKPVPLPATHGGKVVAEGTPEDVADIKGSFTGAYLAPLLNGADRSAQAS